MKSPFSPALNCPEKRPQNRLYFEVRKLQHSGRIAEVGNRIAFGPSIAFMFHVEHFVRKPQRRKRVSRGLSPAATHFFVFQKMSTKPKPVPSQPFKAAHHEQSNRHKRARNPGTGNQCGVVAGCCLSSCATMKGAQRATELRKVLMNPSNPSAVTPADRLRSSSRSMLPSFSI